jgi:hypothetical protein
VREGESKWLAFPHFVFFLSGRPGIPMSSPRIAAIVKSAEETRRRIFASQPFWQRFAHLMMVLASSDTAAWGRTLVMAMIRDGVQGMPDVGGVPAKEWAEGNRFNASRLPGQYLDADKFGAQVYHEALLKIGNPAAAKEFLQELVLSFWSGKPPFKFSDAKNSFESKKYVFTIARTRGLNWRRDQKLDREESLTEDDDEKGSRQRDVTDESGLRHRSNLIEKLLHMPDVVRALKRVHEDAPLYLDLVLDGLDDKSIVTQGMLPHFDSRVPFSWQKTWRPKIYKVINDKIDEYEGLMV